MSRETVPSGARRSRTSLAVTLVLVMAGASLVGVLPASAAAPAPTVHYTFDGNAADQAGGSTLTPVGSCPGALVGDPCNSSSGFGSDADGGYWTWTSSGLNGGGFRVSTNAEIGTTYTLALKFAFTDTGPSWRKIIDYEDRTSDNGFYFYDGLLEFYPFDEQSPSAYPADTVLDLIAVRQSTGGVSGTFTVYAVGVDNLLTEVFSVDDPSGESLAIGNGAGGTLLGFFFDDAVITGESTSGGRVYDVRVWSGVALSEEEIADEVLPGPPAPTPPAPTPSDTTTASSVPSPGTGAAAAVPAAPRFTG
jgi:hypothetical protein